MHPDNAWNESGAVLGSVNLSTTLTTSTLLESVVTALDVGPWDFDPKITFEVAALTPLAIVVVCCAAIALRRVTSSKNYTNDSANNILDDDDDDAVSLHDPELQTPVATDEEDDDKR